ncbi:MAG: family intrarane metalloprotease protein [Firmicutes bacterium]|nr:family intrarane metalloprotease protein [Bacillota bacterium]
MFKNREGKVRSGWKIAAVLAIFLSSITVISIIIGAISSSVLLVTGDLKTEAGSMVPIFTEHGQKVMTAINRVMMFVQEILTILIAILAWKISTKRKLSDMGFTPIKSNFKDLIAGLLFGAGSLTFVFAALVLSGQAEVTSWAPSFSVSQIIALFMFILVGFAEELLCRGYIISVLRQTKSILAIYIISGVIFALMHSANSGIGLLPYMNLILIGMLWAYSYMKSGNIWLPIGYHITWNYFQGDVFGFKVSGTTEKGILTTSYPKNNIFNGGDFGPEGGLFVTLVIVLGFLAIRYYYRNKQFDFLAMDPPAMIVSNEDALVLATEEQNIEDMK